MKKKKAKKRKSKFARLLKEARRLKLVGADKGQRRTIISSRKWENYCERNKIEGKLKNAVIRLSKTSKDARIRAINDAWITMDKRAFKPLRYLLNHERHPDVFKAAINALGKLGDKRAFKPLVEILEQDYHEDFRAEAAKSLGELGDKRAVKPLLKVIAGEDRGFLSEKSIEALGNLGDLKTIPPLVTLLDAVSITRMEKTVNALYSILHREKKSTDLIRIKAGVRFLTRDLTSLEAKTLIVGHMIDPKKKLNLPTDYKDKRQREKVAYMLNLREQAKDHKFFQILKYLGLRDRERR